MSIIHRVTRRLFVFLVTVTTIGCGNPSSSPADGAGAAVITPIVTAPTPPATALTLPLKTGSVRFAVIGDAGRGDQPQYQVSAQMQAYRHLFPFDFVVMVGDNVYDGGTAADYRRKFEEPYAPLLAADVQFFATIGNHDDPRQPDYTPFHMKGQRFYWFKPPSAVARLFGADVAFFMIDTEQLTFDQRTWIDREMAASSAVWKIPVFHRPIYTSGRYGVSARFLRRNLEPIFRKHGVAVAFSGHEHFYERTTPQGGITYFISGGAGSLRMNDIRPSRLTAVGFDTDYHFMLVEIDDHTLYFQAISRSGATIDTGRVELPREAPPVDTPVLR